MLVPRKCGRRFAMWEPYTSGSCRVSSSDTRLEEGARIVTFANGMVARELIVDIDDEGRRLVWAVVGGRFTHHNASVQVFADGKGGSRLVWIADLLPNEIAVDIRAMIEQAAGVMKPTLERE